MREKSPLEAKKTGAAFGGVLAAGASTFLIPGLGPIAGLGVIAAALAGAGFGAAVGGAVKKATAGVPNEDLYFFEESLRSGRSVVMVEAEDAEQAAQVRNLLEQSGGRNVESVRREWWGSIRDRERDYLRQRGMELEPNETDYRAGFEAAMHPATRGREYQDCSDYLQDCYPQNSEREAFRLGFDRGREHLSSTRSTGRELL